MLFVTGEFLVFFVVVYLLYWTLPDKLRIPVLLVSSLYFYATWSFLFLLHLIIVVAVNYVVMEVWRIYPRKWIFVALQIANVCNIAFFKYFYLLADALGALFGLPAWEEPVLRESMRLAGSEIFLPLAISFYTFQVMAYGFDIYRGVYDRKHSFLQVLLFKTFFPQLIAGPIMRSAELLPQIQNLWEGRGARPDRRMMAKGLWYCAIGVFKKVAIADQLLVFAAPLFGNASVAPAEYAPQTIWLGVLACLFMLYADFSAYSDLARGFGYLLGMEIPENFKAPFFMISISDFWRRWHLTFSRWLRDYLYIPLGGSRAGPWRVSFNLFFTFLIGGVWHGASYTFLVWGALMGVIIAGEALLGRYGVPEWPASLPGRAARLLITWILFMATSLFFFAPGWIWCLGALQQMFNLPAFLDGDLKWLANLETLLYATLAVLLFHFVEEKPQWFRGLRNYEAYLLPAAALLLVIIITQFGGGPKDFFYFQF